MKVAMYHGQQDIRLEEVPTPEIHEDEVLVEMRVCGICGSDLMDWYLKNRTPLVLGHEPGGIIAKAGNKVEGFSVGDRVFVHHHVACLTCYYCRHGDFTLCERFHKTNIEPGGFAEYFRVPAPNLQIDTLKVPESITLEEAVFIEPVGCCLRALKKCQILTGDVVAIIGTGTTGIIHVELSKLHGAAKVIVSDLVDYRLNVAKRLGADVTVNPEREDTIEVAKAETNGRGVDLAIVTAPNLSAYRTGLNICRRGGKLCVFAPIHPGEYLQLSLKELFFSETQIVPSYSCSHLDTKRGLELMRSGRINLKELVTHRFSLRDTAKAFQTALETKESLKVLVTSE